jgi:hypothetical protein
MHDGVLWADVGVRRWGSPYTVQVDGPLCPSDRTALLPGTDLSRGYHLVCPQCSRTFPFDKPGELYPVLRSRNEVLARFEGYWRRARPTD